MRISRNRCVITWRNLTLSRFNFRGWAGFQNGELIALIDGRFDVFLTADQNLRYQQNLQNRSIAIVELPFIRRKDIPKVVDAIRAAIITAACGDYI